MSEPPLDHIPPELVAAADYEPFARQRLDHAVYEHIAGGAADGITLARNRRAFEELTVVSRVLRDFSGASTAVELPLGRFPHPLILGPVAHQKLVHPKGELAGIAAAEAMETPFVASTLSSFTLEQIAAAAPNARRWFQLYIQPRRDATLNLVRRAEDAGYSAIVVTVDVPVTALRHRARRAGFAMPEDVAEVNLAQLRTQPRALEPGQSPVFDGLMADAPDWEDIRWLVEQTHLPVLIKGINHPKDAGLAADLGIAGIVISNHGGRSLDGLPASLDALGAARKTLGPEFPLLVDGGIRSGGDVFKALATGADAVFLGRPQVYALAVAGALGVAHMLRTLRQELEVTMALAGCPTVADIGSDNLFEAF